MHATAPGDSFGDPLPAGGSYIDIYQMHGVGIKTFYDIVWDVCTAITECLPITFVRPDKDKDAELERLASYFDAQGTGVLQGCVAAIDGMAVRIYKPKPSDAPDPVHYYNRKGFYAVVLQAAVDGKKRLCMCMLVACVEYAPCGVCWIHTCDAVA